MVFADVTALADSTPSTNDNSDIADVSLLNGKVSVNDYGTLELNQFLLDGSKTVINNPNDIAFMSQEQSGAECKFAKNPLVSFAFSQNHTSAGITLNFGFDYPTEIVVTWYAANNIKLLAKTYYPDATTYVCRQQIENYQKITVEFIKTRLPYRYAELQWIIYGLEIDWTGADIQSAKVTEEVDVTSSTLSINTANISIIDANNDFDIENDDGAWKAIQKTQKVTLTEYVNDEPIPCGVFFIDGKSFSKNIASFKLIDRIGLLDNYTFDQGEMYTNKPIGDIIKAIFACANITDYEIFDDVYNLTVSGTIDIQSCREALQMCCFTVGALADDSRTGTIKIYKPDRYVKYTIPINRKFNGNTEVSLKEYVSGVSITSNVYTLDVDASNIYDDTLPAGDTRIEFSDPYDPTTIIVSSGTIKEKKVHYMIVNMKNSGQCTITGKKYEKTTLTTAVNDEYVDANEVANIKEFGDLTLHNSDIMKDTADSLLRYYKLMKEIKLKYIIEKEQSGDWVAVNNVKGQSATSLVESQSIDLVGGFLSTATCWGYSVVVTDYAFTGTELYAGGDYL
jgi:hypothetical protein